MQEVNYAQPPATRTVVVERGGPGCLLRVLWFVFIGWWLALGWIVVAWIFNITIIGLPIGLAMLNRVPQVMTLSPGSGQVVEIHELGGITRISEGTKQFPFLLRVVYFILVGWWLSLIWTVVGYVMMVIPFTWPIGLAMFHVIGFITTLRRN